MKRLWIAIVLLLICAAVAVAEYATVQNEYNYYTNSLNKADELISLKEYSDALTLVERTQCQWESTQQTLNIFLLHEDVESIYEAMSELKKYAENKDSEEFLSLSSKTKRQLLCLKQSELPILENIM